jgi:hypothetical protein
MADNRNQLSNAHKLGNPDEIREFDQGWAAGIECIDGYDLSQAMLDLPAIGLKSTVYVLKKR